VKQVFAMSIRIAVRLVIKSMRENGTEYDLLDEQCLELPFSQVYEVK
jgi:hypothetical protein